MPEKNRETKGHQLKELLGYGLHLINHNWQTQKLELTCEEASQIEPRRGKYCSLAFI